jgi:hypothetical protein
MMKWDVVIVLQIESDNIEEVARTSVMVCKLLNDNGFPDAHGTIQPAE